jgi:hypothetical protein
MAWFKVDDKLHSHKKIVRAGDAMALWVIAGSWCADQLTDGFVPDYMAARLVPGGADMADRLVDAGLWVPDVCDGDEGFRFKDWDEYQPTRDDVEARRERDRKRKTKQPRDDSGQYTEGVREDSARSPDGFTPSPTRPDPSRTQPDPKEQEQGARKRATTLPEGWKPAPEPELIKAIGGDVAARRELEKFRDHWASQPDSKARKKDWQATWRNWLRKSGEWNPRGSPPTIEDQWSGVEEVKL